MATTTTTTNKPLNPRAQDLSPKGYNRAALFSGKALDFDGVNDILTLPTALTSSLSTTSVTFSTYVYPDFTTWSGDRDDAFTFGERGVILAFNSGNIYYYFRHESSGWDGLQVPNAAVTMQAWNHMVVTIDLGTDQYKAYVNGKLVASAGTARASIQYEGNALTIGAQAGARFFDGKIAGFKIFNTALTAAQVADLYLNPEKITPDGVATSALKLWLPMMEGSGASAYDGSGNGNDGTINGATWTAGVGAPVAQTALVSWNKGINGAIRSENFGSGDWVKNATAVTDNTIAAPNGTTTADTLVNNTANNVHRIYQLLQAFTGTGALSFSIYLKYKDHRYFSFGLTDDSIYRAQIVVDLLNGTITDNFVDGSTTITSSTLTAVGDGWYKLSATINATGAWNTNLYALGVMLNQSTFTSAGYVGTGTGVYIWGVQANIGTAQPYIKTNATAQTSAVLVPEGLTAGASIFGTDIITPRNAFALNLDGASWAQVGDNASLDISPAMTMEVWAKLDATLTTKHFLVKSSGSWAPPYGRYVIRQTGGAIEWWFDDFSNNDSIAYSTIGWAHFVVTKNGTAEVIYINGVQAGTHTGAASITASAFPLYIGRADVGEYLDNQLANPRIYNRALTAAEVLRNYNADKAKFGL